MPLLNQRMILDERITIKKEEGIEYTMKPIKHWGRSGRRALLLKEVLTSMFLLISLVYTALLCIKAIV